MIRGSIIRKGMKRIIVALAFGLAFTATGAIAQHSSGNIIGEAVAGDTVVIHGPDNGFHREMEIKEDGKYQVRRVPTGDYTVSVKHADGTLSPPKMVSVRVGSTARVQ